MLNSGLFQSTGQRKGIEAAADEDHNQEDIALFLNKECQRACCKTAACWQVMDMASGKVYFWDSEADEVAWEPPLGASPRSKQDNAVTFAAHVTTTDMPAATDTDPSADVAVDMDADGGDSMQALMPQSDAAGGLAERQQPSTSGESAGQAERHSSEETEDGQLAEAGSVDAQPATVSGAAAVLVVPDAPTGISGQQICDRLRKEAQSLCRNVPQIVRLAIEAEIRMQDWQMFSSKQQRAVDKSQPQEAMSWTDFQDHMQWRWQSIQAAVPAAMAEARQLQHRMEQDLEDGEMPPLPADSPAAPPAVNDSDPVFEIQPALPREDDFGADVLKVSASGLADLSAVDLSAAEVPKARLDDPVAIELEDAGENASQAPPLPAEQPTAAASSASAAAGQPVSAAGLSAVDEEADMELDMDVDSEASSEGDAGQPASAGAAGTSAGLPNWAGYYMAHGYTYPYYGT